MKMQRLLEVKNLEVRESVVFLEVMHYMCLKLCLHMILVCGMLNWESSWIKSLALVFEHIWFLLGIYLIFQISFDGLFGYESWIFDGDINHFSIEIKINNIGDFRNNTIGGL